MQYCTWVASGSHVKRLECTTWFCVAMNGSIAIANRFVITQGIYSSDNPNPVGIFFPRDWCLLVSLCVFLNMGIEWWKEQVHYRVVFCCTLCSIGTRETCWWWSVRLCWEVSNPVDNDLGRDARSVETLLDVKNTFDQLWKTTCVETKLRSGTIET